MTGKGLRRAMTRLKFDVDEVGARMGVDRRTVYRWLADETPIPKSVAILMRGWSEDPIQRAAILAKGGEQP